MTKKILKILLVAPIYLVLVYLLANVLLHIGTELYRIGDTYNKTEDIDVLKTFKITWEDVYSYKKGWDLYYGVFFVYILVKGVITPIVLSIHEHQMEKKIRIKELEDEEFYLNDRNRASRQKHLEENEDSVNTQKTEQPPNTIENQSQPQVVPVAIQFTDEQLKVLGGMQNKEEKEQESDNQIEISKVKIKQSPKQKPKQRPKNPPKPFKRNQRMSQTTREELHHDDFREVVIPTKIDKILGDEVPKK